MACAGGFEDTSFRNRRFKTAIGNRATSAGPEGVSSCPLPSVERDMLSAEEETSHANDVGFGPGRSGAVGDPSKCSAASGGAVSVARRHERVPSTHEALILLYVGPQEHRTTGGVRAAVGPQEYRPTGASAGYERL